MNLILNLSTQVAEEMKTLLESIDNDEPKAAR